MMNILLSTGRKVSRTDIPYFSKAELTRDVRSYLGKRIHHFAKCCSPNFPIAYLPPAFSRSRDSERLTKDRSPLLSAPFSRARETSCPARHDVAGQIESSRRKTRRNSISIVRSVVGNVRRMRSFRRRTGGHPSIAAAN